MMPELPQKLAAELATLVPDAAAMLVAVSGGPDSMALLRGLLEVAESRGHTIMAAHLDHQLRGEQSAADAAWVARQCERLRVPVEVGTVDVPGLASAEGRGIEETARQARYTFLEQAAGRAGCSHIAVAHTADDQAETILHHVIRGTGLAGLRGIPRSRVLDSGVTLIRPLLGVPRDEVRAYLGAIGQESLTDDSNDDPRFTRNRIRQTLLPLLRAEFNPNIDEALRRLSQQSGDIQTSIEFAAANLLDEALIAVGTDFCRLVRDPLRKQPRHFVREAFRLLWQRMDWPRQRMGYDDWDRLAMLVHQPCGGNFPDGIVARRRRYVIEIERVPR